MVYPSHPISTNIASGTSRMLNSAHAHVHLMSTGTWQDKVQQQNELHDLQQQQQRLMDQRYLIQEEQEQLANMTQGLCPSSSPFHPGNPAVQGNAMCGVQDSLMDTSIGGSTGRIAPSSSTLMGGMNLGNSRTSKSNEEPAMIMRGSLASPNFVSPHRGGNGGKVLLNEINAHGMCNFRQHPKQLRRASAPSFSNAHMQARFASVGAQARMDQQHQRLQLQQRQMQQHECEGLAPCVQRQFPRQNSLPGVSMTTMADANALVSRSRHDLTNTHLSASRPGMPGRCLGPSNLRTMMQHSRIYRAPMDTAVIMPMTPNGVTHRMPHRNPSSRIVSDSQTSSFPPPVSNNKLSTHSLARGFSPLEKSTESQDQQSEDAVLPRVPCRPRAPGLKSFPTKLHQILDNEEYHYCIAWMPHGRSWRILNSQRFEKEILPKHFRSARYPSFMRQVNGWGFRRITDGPDLNAYFHPCFVKGMPELCEDMRRPQKGQNPLEWAQEYPNKNPDFYKIHAMAPLPMACNEIVMPPPYPVTSSDGVEDERVENSMEAVEVSNDGESACGLDGDDDDECSDHVMITESPRADLSTNLPHTQGEGKVEDKALPELSPFSHSYFVESNPNMDDATVESWGGDDFSIVPTDDEHDEHFGQDNFAYDIFSTQVRPLRPRTSNSTTKDAAVASDTKSSTTASPPKATPVRHIIAPTSSGEKLEESTCSPPPTSSATRLSQADLKYLDYQNKLLLRQTLANQLQQQQKQVQQPQVQPPEELQPSLKAKGVTMEKDETASSISSPETTVLTTE